MSAPTVHFVQFLGMCKCCLLGKLWFSSE